MVRFTTVIPMYNKEQTIRRALYSVLDQDYFENNLNEIIVVDDGSTDHSLRVVKSIKQQFSDRLITIHSQANAGVSAARNKGVALAQNEYITFLDADDSYECNFYNEISLLAQRFPYAAMLGTAYRFVNTDLGIKRDASLVGLGKDQQQILDDYFYSAAYGDLPITSSSVCIKKSVLTAIGGFPINENMGEDQAVWSQISLKYLVAISKLVCANYFEDTNHSLMKTEPVKNEMPFSLRLQTQLDQQKIPHRLKGSVQHYIAGHLLDLVRRNKQSGNLRAANKMVKDKRSRAQFKRWCYWYARVLLKQYS